MNDCTCVYVDDDYDRPEFYDAKLVKAKKEHQCSECYRVIHPGEMYERINGKWDGDVSTFKTCPDCKSIQETFFCDHFLHGGMWEYFDEHLRECNAELDADAIAKLTPDARATVCDKIETYWAFYEDDDEEDE